MSKIQKADIAIEMTVIKTGTCPTLSGRSALTYEMATDPETELHYRISANSGGGFWSPEWIAWKAIEPVIKEIQPVTSTPLKTLLKGKSVNTSGFLLAVLIKEGLLEVVPDKRRQFRVTGATPGEVIPAVTPAKKTKAVTSKAKK